EGAQVVVHRKREAPPLEGGRPLPGTGAARPEDDRAILPLPGLDRHRRTVHVKDPGDDAVADQHYPIASAGARQPVWPRRPHLGLERRVLSLTWPWRAPPGGHPATGPAGGRRPGTTGSR